MIRFKAEPWLDNGAARVRVRVYGGSTEHGDWSLLGTLVCTPGEVEALTELMGGGETDALRGHPQGRDRPH
jgi:hypothetical protein